MRSRLAGLLVFLGVLFGAAAAHAQCVPSQAPAGSLGCQPTLSPAQTGDYFYSWRPGTFPNSAGKLTIDDIATYIGAGSLASPPPIGNVTPNAGAFSTLAVGASTPGTAQFSINSTGDITLPTTATGAVPTIGNAFIGDTNRVWFQGALFGFGQRPTTTSATNYANVLTVQRVPAYTGASTGNPSALLVLTNVGSTVTGGNENGLISQMTTTSSGGTITAATIACFKQGSGPLHICNNTNAQDQTGRKSSVGKGLVPQENDLWASGPDDQSLRIGLDMINGEFQPSTDGATTFAYGGLRVRGREMRNPSSGALAVPTDAIIGNGVTTQSIGQGGLVGSFETAYLSDGANVASFSATSASQTAVTSTSFSGGVTTLTFTVSQNAPPYIWPNALVTGTNIAANTHVLTYAYDNVTTVTLTIDTPTAGALSSGQALTFTNKIATAFSAGGYITTAAFTSPGYNVDPVGNTKTLTYQGTQTSTVAAVATTFGTCNAGNRGKRGVVTDATAPTFLGALTGGGGITTPVFCNGGAWVSE